MKQIIIIIFNKVEVLYELILGDLYENMLFLGKKASMKVHPEPHTVMFSYGFCWASCLMCQFHTWLVLSWFPFFCLMLCLLI